MYQNEPEMYWYFRQMSKMYRNFRQMSKIPNITNNFQDFWHFRYIPVHFWLQNWLKMAQKWSKITKIIQEFSTLTKNDGRFDKCQKCTEIFVFRLSAFPVHFPEITRISESLIETHGLSKNKFVVKNCHSWKINCKIL